MSRITIDKEACARCGLCTRVCARGILQRKDESAVPTVVRPSTCFACGHCVAVCPTGAISHPSYPEGTVRPISKDLLPGYEQVLELVRARRSRRVYDGRPVERADVEKVIEAGRFAPTGHNAQSVEYVVVQDKDRLRRVAELTVEALLKMMRPFKSPIGRMVMRPVVGARHVALYSGMAAETDGLVEIFRGGTDVILHDAPTLLLFASDTVRGFPSADANLALQNATLAAEALGLGSFYTGFVVAACSRDRRIPEFLGLPETHKVFAGMAMGYPKVTFSKWPERKKANVSWM